MNAMLHDYIITSTCLTKKDDPKVSGHTDPTGCMLSIDEIMKL